jgi:hypothetical protein
MTDTTIVEELTDLVIVYCSITDHIEAYWDGYGITLHEGKTNMTEYSIVAGLDIPPRCRWYVVAIRPADVTYVTERLASGLHWARMIYAQDKPVVMQ